MARLSSSVWSVNGSGRHVVVVPDTRGIEVAGTVSGFYAAKLSIPHQGRFLPRARVLASMRAPAEGGVVGLVAGPGYGKTAFLADMAHRWDGPVIYFSLDADDRDPARFLACLIEGVEQACPGMGESAAERLAECSDAGRETLHVAATLLGDICTGPGRALLVLDDLHVVEDSEAVVAAVQFLVDGLPLDWTVALASRRKLPIALDSHRAGGRVTDIGLRQLRLTPGEVRAWASDIWGVTISLSDARALWRLTEGWPVAYVLLGTRHDWRRKPPDGAQLLRWAARGRHFNEYLAGTVFKGLDPEVADVLMRGASLGRVSFPRDAPLFAGLSGGAGGAERVLENLVADGFLVAQSGFRTFTLHRLLRAFAEREARHRDPGQVNRLAVEAAHHLEVVGDLRGAIALHLEHGEPADAVGPLRVLAATDLNASAVSVRPEWFDKVPGEVVAREPWLLLLRARIIQRRGCFVEAEPVYAASARLFEKTGERLGQLQARMGQAFCLYMSGRWDDSEATLRLAECCAATPSERAELRATRGNVLLSLCRWDEAVEHFELALASVSGAERQALELRIFSYRSRLFFMRGRYPRSVDWARKAVRLAASGGRVSYAIALDVAATILYATGRYDEAAMHAEAAEALVRARGYAFLEGPVLLARAGIDLGGGRTRQALARLKTALQLAREGGDVELEVGALDMIACICRLNRNAGRALAHHRAALDLVERHQLAVYEHVRTLCGVGMDLAVSAHHADAESTLEQAARLSRQLGFDAQLCGALFYLGWLYALRGSESAAARTLGEAIRLAEENEYVHFVLQEAAAATPILALCARLGHRSFITESIAPRLRPRLQGYLADLTHGSVYPCDVALGPPSRSRFRPASASASGDEVTSATVAKVEALTVREAEILGMIAQGLQNKVIAARLFITERTIKTHANRIYRKLGVGNRLQAVLVLQEFERTKRTPEGRGRARRQTATF